MQQVSDDRFFALWLLVVVLPASAEASSQVCGAQVLGQGDTEVTLV